jgi:cyclic beta-1,2-glucan synthetase
MAAELFSLLNPINHASTRAGIHRYKVEPYVACADVYTAAAHVGRGGWTWYTGSAGWMYRTAVEGMLGFQLRGDRLRIEPCISRTWASFEISYRYRSASYLISVSNPHGVNRGIRETALDGIPLPGPGCDIALRDDGKNHTVRVVLG